MLLAHVALDIATISTGLFTGLLLTMLCIFQPVLNQLAAIEYAELMQRFLNVARRSPLNIALMFTSLLAPIPTLFSFYQSSNWLAFGAVLIGVTIFFIGMFLISRFFNEPLYDQILSWTIKELPTNWETTRQQWYVLNLIRVCASGATFLLFLSMHNVS